MYYYENLIECILYLKTYEKNKLFLEAFYEELATEKTPRLITSHPELTLRYLKFKQDYLRELATAKSLLYTQYYLNELQNKQGLKSQENLNIELRINYQYQGVNNGNR